MQDPVPVCNLPVLVFLFAKNFIKKQNNLLFSPCVLLEFRSLLVLASRTDPTGPNSKVKIIDR